MKVQVNMVNVEDGDAIIVELFEQQKSAVIMIDGGRSKYYQSRLKTTLANILMKHQKDGPDLVVCTHYDGEHIECVLDLVDDYKSAIKHILIHPHLIEIKAHLEGISEAYFSSRRGKMITNFRTFENYKLLTETFNQALCFYQSFCLIYRKVLRNTHLLQAAKR